MLLLGCLGDLLRFEKREIQVATFAPDRSSPEPCLCRTETRVRATVYTLKS